MPQVDKKAYQLESYSTVDRWASYYRQLSLALSLSPDSVLEIGVGDKVFGSYIRNNTAIHYIGADFDPTVKPDVVADVLRLPFRDGEFDLVCAFEILEHLPFEQFDAALKELARVSRRDVLISLPHFGPQVKMDFKLPLLPRARIFFKVPLAKKHAFNGQHHWEIGKKGYPTSRIRKAVAAHFHIDSDFVDMENPYHHFFVLRKKKGA